MADKRRPSSWKGLDLLRSSSNKKLLESCFNNYILFIVTENNTYLLPTHEVCGIDTQDRIYGGSIASLTDFPWMCLVEYERKGE